MFTEADSQSLMQVTKPSSSPHQLLKLDADKQEERVKTVEPAADWRRVHKTDVRVNVNSHVSTTIDTALNDLTLLSAARNQSTSSGVINSTAPTTKLARKVLAELLQHAC